MNEPEKKDPYAHLPPWKQVQRRAEDYLRTKRYFKFMGTENRKMRRAGRANVRYLTRGGRIISGRELFKKGVGDVHSTTVCHPKIVKGEATELSLNELRRMRKRDRAQFFNPKKAWRPATDERPED